MKRNTALFSALVWIVLVGIFVALLSFLVKPLFNTECQFAEFSGPTGCFSISTGEFNLGITAVYVLCIILWGFISFALTTKLTQHGSA